MKLISVVTPCLNEAGNVRELYERVRAVFNEVGRYRYEHIFIDNASTDTTLAILREIAAADRNVKVIANQRNFGQIRSPHHAFLQARGEAVISLAGDLQDPPELIPALVDKWEKGFPIVLGVKKSTRDGWLLRGIRRGYYRLVNRLADITLIENATGFGLYDRRFVELVRSVADPYPYTRGLVAEFGFETALIPYDQLARKAGVTSNNFFSLYDVAMTGITSHSKVPLRVATIAGFTLSALSLAVALIYLILKLLFWYRYPAGIAPILIGLFVAFSIQLFFLGLLGEYVAVIHTRLMNRPLVVEKERINFEENREGR
jgi:polyisoprenyl-phosphate glycosyltransferase